MSFLTKKLAAQRAGGEGKVGAGAGGGGVFCYVNSVFAPGLDEGVGGLWRVSGGFSLLVGVLGMERGGEGRDWVLGILIGRIADGVGL